MLLGDRELRVKVMNFDPACASPNHPVCGQLGIQLNFLLSIVYFSCKGKYVTNEKEYSKRFASNESVQFTWLDWCMVGRRSVSVQGGLKLEEVIGNFSQSSLIIGDSVGGAIPTAKSGWCADRSKP